MTFRDITEKDSAFAPELQPGARVAERLADQLGRPVRFIPGILSKRVKDEVKSAKAGEILLLENLRFDPL